MAEGTAWEEMTKAYPAQNKVSVTNASVLLVSRSDFRVALVISASPDSKVFLSWGRAADQQDGIMLPINGAPLLLCVEQYGRMVSGPIFAVAPDGNTTVTFVELIHPCPCMR